MRLPIIIKPVIIAWFSMVFLVSAANAQPGIEAYDRGDLDAVRAYLAQGQGSEAEVDFLRAALTVDADSAVERYRQVAIKYPNSPIGRRALERIQQYYYAQGFYTKAEEVGKSLGDEKSTVRPIDVPDTITPKPQSDNIQPDTVAEVASKSEVELIPATALQSLKVGGYALQLGAFTDPDNVRKLVTTLEKAGYTVEVSPVTMRGKHLQSVRAVGFANQEAALTAAGELKKKFGLNPILLPPDRKK